MKQYLDILQKILDDGIEKENGRINMPNTIGISHASMQFDMKDGFPMVTTKKLYIRGIIHELLWFLRGKTNIKYLVDNKTNIWNQDAYNWYIKCIKSNSYNTNDIMYIDDTGKYCMFTEDEFINKIKDTNETELPICRSIDGNHQYILGDLGKVYGYQWRNQNGVDQIAQVLNELKINPYSRYHIINGWNAADMHHKETLSDDELYERYIKSFT